jgi:hypothetical protein
MVLIYAPGSTDTADLCSREHKCCWICSREHKYCLFVLPGAQISLDRAPGSTNTACLCSREHQYCWSMLPATQILLAYVRIVILILMVRRGTEHTGGAAERSPRAPAVRQCPCTFPRTLQGGMLGPAPPAWTLYSNTYSTLTHTL